MSSEYFDRFFAGTYSKVKSILKVFIISTLAFKVLLSCLVSSDMIFESFQMQLFLSKILFVFILELFEKKSTTVKKFTLYAILEILNFFYKSFSLYYYQDEAILCCIISTIFTMLFQARIFENSFNTSLVMIKHIFIWFLFDIANWNLNSHNLFAIILSGEIICMWIMFEQGKRTRLKHYHNLSKQEEQNALQISEILRLFQDGLIILNQNFIIQYKNETANTLINTEPDNFINELKTIKFQDQRLVFESIKNIKFEAKQVSISLGIAERNNLLYEWTAKMIKWNDSLCYMVIIKDVTSLLKMERISAENAAKSALIRSVSHELRTPVHGIILLVDSLMQDINEICKERLINIKTCAELLAFQIGDILDYSELISKTFKLNKSSCNLKACIIECTDLIKYQAKIKGLEIKLKIDELIPNEFFLDYKRLQKVLINLLTNAIKYTIKGSIEICAINTGNSIEISVKDTGIGIPKERLIQIFDMFSDKVCGMSGLGLHVSNCILEYFGSCLKAYSQEGKGSRFYFCLYLIENIPRYQYSDEIEIPGEENKDLLIPELSFNIFHNQKPKVLIVDDNDFNRLLLASILKKHDIQHIDVANGKAAVKVIKEMDRRNTPISCIIMDCNMPVMDGWEASKKINRKYSKGRLKFLPSIIGHTAYSSIEDIQKCYDSGMISCLLKPTSQEQVLAILQQYI